MPQILGYVVGFVMQHVIFLSIDIRANDESLSCEGDVVISHRNVCFRGCVLYVSTTPYHVGHVLKLGRESGLPGHSEPDDI